jgi:hypothetical protein
MLGLLSGYWHSQCLFVLAELGIADRLSPGPASSRDLAEACGADPEALFRFLRAMGDVGLVSRIGEDLFAATPMSALLADGHPGSLRPLARFGGHPLHWRAWGNLLHTIRTGQCAFEASHGMPFYDALRESPDAAEVFGQVMRSGQALDDEIAANLDFPDRGRIVDVGGGSGAFLEKLVERKPGITGIVFDLGSALGTRHTDGSSDRIEYLKGDFFDWVPAGGDAYLLKFVLHNWDDERALRILKNCRHAMADGSRLFAVEIVLPDWSQRSHANRHDLNMMVLTSGRERTQAQYEALFGAAHLRLDGYIDFGSGPTILAARPMP